jgi:hypothetical protein
MRSELRRVTRGANPHRSGRILARLVWVLPAVVWLTSSACQTSDEGDADAGATAQAEEPTPGAGAPTGMNPEATQRQIAMMTELQAIDMVLSPIREQAIQDPEMQAQQTQVVEQVDAAMESISPGILEKRTRFDELRADYAAAQQAGDQERLQSLAGELQPPQAALQQTQSQAMQREDVASSLTRFREGMFDKIRALDPSADSLLNRAQALSEELEAMMREGGSGS